MTKQTRLSWIELVTIALVLAVASVGMVPRFSEAGEESKTGELIDALQKMRTQLALYRVQHEDRLPPTDFLEGFNSAITTRVGEYGPYIKKIPVNPYNRLNTLRFDGEPAGANKAAWRLDTKGGMFQADNDAACALFEKSGCPSKCDVVVNPCCRESCAWKIRDPAEAIAEGGSAFL